MFFIIINNQHFSDFSMFIFMFDAHKRDIFCFYLMCCEFVLVAK